MQADALRPRLLAVAAELELSLPASQADGLLAYLSLLERWNATYNLTAVREPERMLTQHLADCLAMIAPLRRHVQSLGADRPCRLLDVGSGGGLPGVVIAVLCTDIRVQCVDAVGKKAAFVQQVATSLRLPNLLASHSRVEQLQVAPFDVITSRAFASLADFTRLTGALLGENGVWLAMKGKDPIVELNELPSNIAMFHVEPLRVPDLDAERCLVWMRRSL